MKPTITRREFDRPVTIREFKAVEWQLARDEGRVYGQAHGRGQTIVIERRSLRIANRIDQNESMAVARVRPIPETGSVRKPDRVHTSARDEIACVPVQKSFGALISLEIERAALIILCSGR
jgi:hypothetical protein